MSGQYPPQPPYNNQPNGDNQQYPFYQPPQYPQPGQQLPQQPVKKKRKSLKERWNSGPIGKFSVIVTVILALLVCAACSGIVNAVTRASQSTAQPTQSAQSVATTKPAVTTQPTATVKPKPTTKPTVAAQIAATHGTPVFGGFYSDFIGKYGQPVIQGTANSETFAPTNDQVIVNVTPQDGKVTRMIITGPDSWTQQQTESFCTAFLPADASEFNRTAGDTPFIDYHSSMGEIIISLQPQSCIIYLGGQ